MPTEYVPCILVRETDNSSYWFRVHSIDDRGNTDLKMLGMGYKESLIPVEMSEMVALMEGQRKLLPGPFKLAQVPEWAKAWFASKRIAP